MWNPVFLDCSCILLVKNVNTLHITCTCVLKINKNKMSHFITTLVCAGIGFLISSTILTLALRMALYDMCHSFRPYVSMGQSMVISFYYFLQIENLMSSCSFLTAFKSHYEYRNIINTKFICVNTRHSVWTISENRQLAESSFVWNVWLVRIEPKKRWMKFIERTDHAVVCVDSGYNWQQLKERAVKMWRTPVYHCLIHYWCMILIVYCRHIMLIHATQQESWQSH